MKKKILIPVGMAALFLCASWQAAETTVSPFVFGGQREILVYNKQGRL